MTTKFYTIESYIQTNEDWHECHNEGNMYHDKNQYIFDEDEYQKHVLKLAHQVISSFKIPKKYEKNREVLKQLHQTINERYHTHHQLNDNDKPIHVKAKNKQGQPLELDFMIGFGKGGSFQINYMHSYFDYGEFHEIVALPVDPDKVVYLPIVEIYRGLKYGGTASRILHQPFDNVEESHNFISKINENHLKPKNDRVCQGVHMFILAREKRHIIDTPWYNKQRQNIMEAKKTNKTDVSVDISDYQQIQEIIGEIHI